MWFCKFFFSRRGSYEALEFRAEKACFERWPFKGNSIDIKSGEERHALFGMIEAYTFATLERGVDSVTFYSASSTVLRTSEKEIPELAFLVGWKNGEVLAVGSGSCPDGRHVWLSDRSRAFECICSCSSCYEVAASD